VGTQSPSSGLLFLLTGLPLTLALFTFLLEWRRGGLVDPVCIGQLAGDNSSLPGVQLDLLSLLTGGHAVANSDCANQLDRSDVVGFPYHVELQYAMLNANATPKVNSLTFLKP
jgi:hypothetical protein